MPQLAERAHQILRQIDRERQVVPRVDQQRLAIAQPLEIPARADRLPQRAQQIELDVAVEPLAHVRGRQAAPDDVGEIRRDVIERLRVESAARAPSSAARGTIRGSCRECRCGRSPARCSHAIARRASSTACRQTCTRPRDVRADDVVGAVELGRHALIVIRQAEAQRAHAVPSPAACTGRRGRRRRSSTAAARAPPRAARRRRARASESSGSTPCCSRDAAWRARSETSAADRRPPPVVSV